MSQSTNNWTAPATSPVIWWIRRDLRLHDNQALHAALARGDGVLPCFIIDPRLMHGRHASPKRRAFLLAALGALDADLRARGSHLWVATGDPLAVLTRLREKIDARAIVAEADYSPYARRRDGQVAAALPLELVGGPTLRHPAEVRKADGTPYTVFTPFKRAWLSLPLPDRAMLLPAPAHIPTPAAPPGEPLPEEEAPHALAPFPPTEAEARRRLEAFCAGPIAAYADRRNQLDAAGTSRLSPYLRFGLISPRAAFVAAGDAARHPEARQGAEVWMSELIWREFYTAILYHFPRVLRHSFQAEYDGIQWKNEAQAFDAWCQGHTGYPVVDAAMRQLVATGWIHNRARMLVASFLVKDLLIDWRWGERFFMQHLLDGDPAANNGGWQWTAGVGTDAAPYFRIFNPTTQGRKFDPEGRFIRRWLPELAAVPDRYIHTPWEMPATVQAQAGCRIGQDYPPPMVDHAFARQRTLDAYAQARAQRKIKTTVRNRVLRINE